MKIYFNIDLTSKLVVMYNYTPTFEFMFEKEISKEKADFIDQEFPFVKFENDDFVSSLQHKTSAISKETKFQRIQELKSFLASTDHKIMKHNESLIKGSVSPYPNILEIISEREQWRNEINMLEAQL